MSSVADASDVVAHQGIRLTLSRSVLHSQEHESELLSREIGGQIVGPSGEIYQSVETGETEINWGVTLDEQTNFNVVRDNTLTHLRTG